MCKFATKLAKTGQSRPKFRVLYARKYTSLKKVYHRRSWQWWLLWARDDYRDYDDEDDEDDGEDEEDGEDGDEDDGEDVDFATQVVDSSKETVDAMFFLTEEEERSAR